MIRDISNFNLLNYNTFGIDASCDRFVEVSSVDELCSILPSISITDTPLLLLGGGSNLLLTNDYHGTVLHSAIKGHSVVLNGDDILIRCGSGETFDDIIALCVSKGWYGAENLSLIPGEVGASAIQNIGAYGSEAKDIIFKVEAVEISTGKRVEFSNSDCDYSYRQSRFKHDWLDKYFITYVTYKLSTIFTPKLAYGNIQDSLDKLGITNPTVEQLRNVIIDIRNAKLPNPKVQGNAGSFFMNPIVTREKYEALLVEYPDMPHYTIDADNEKIPAGWMIDRCGWKGRSLGRAGVCERQALVLVNKGGATGSDIVNLCEAIRHDVFEKFGIFINPEVNIK